MEQLAERRPNELIQNSLKKNKFAPGQARNIWVIFALITVTAIIVGGGVYWWQKSVIKNIQNENLKSQQAFQEQIDTLQEQIAQLQKEEDVFPSVEGPEEPTTDTRILLTPENINQYSPNCEEKFNFDPPNTTVTYSSRVKGFSLEIPYNSKWGSDKFRINPCDEREEYLAFGPISAGEGCSLIRSHFLYFRPAKSADGVISDIKKDPIYPDFFPLKPKKITINNLEVVKYETSGFCDSPHLQVIGRKYNYELARGCAVDSAKEFQYLEDIVKTIKLIN